MEPPPPTPLSEAPSNIFVNSDGSPLAVFAEASHILNRPQLVRKLKRHGAAIRSDPKDAQIILINPESSSGRLLGRNWGKDANKVVLDSAWVNKSFTSGKPLLSADAYGGYLFIDDGRSIEDDGDQESDDEIAKSPLPTPRDTPVEPVKPSKPGNPHSNPDEIHYPYSASQAAKVPHDFTDTGPSRATEVPPAPAQPPFNMDMANMAQFLQQMTSATVPTASQIPMVMNPAAMLPMFQSGFTFADPQSSMQTHPFWLAMQDALINKGLFPQVPPVFPQAAFPSAPAPPVSPVREQVLPYPPIPSAEEHTSLLNSKGKQRADSPPAKRRKTSSSSFQEALSSSHKSNGLSMGPPSSVKKIFMRSTNDPLAFFVQVGGHNRFNLVQSIKKNGGAIVSNVGEADYVVLFPPSNSKSDKGAHERFLAMAESGGQPAVSPKFITDCIEHQQLIDTDAYEFVANNNKRRRPVKSGSPDEPESEDGDEEDTPIQTQQAIKQRQEDEKERKRVEKCRREMERRKRLREDKERQRSSRPQTPVLQSSVESLSQLNRSPGKHKKTHSLDVTESIRPRSPTPPSERTQVLHGTNGHFRFTEEENAYAISYGKLLVERNHEISMSAVGTAIYKKMPHHTLKSWRTHLASLAGFNYDDWVKKAGIAYRKRQKQQSLGDNTPIPQSPAIKGDFKPFLSGQHLQPPRYVQSPSPILQGSIAQIPVPVAKMEPSKATLEDDLVTISNFFAECNDDQTETEEAIWAKLTAQASCKTEVTWEEFYQRHSGEVQRRYQLLVDGKASKASGT